MQCNICSRIGGPKLPFLCPTDARNYLYGPRIENATILIEKDSLDHELTAALSEREKNAKMKPDITPLGLIAIKAETNQILDRTQLILSKAQELRNKVEQARLDLVRKKAVISRRKSDLVSASYGIDARRSNLINDVEKSIQTIKVKWHQKHIATISARSFLCGEAARLYGLKKVKNKSLKDEYKLGRSFVVHLEKLHSVSAAQVSTVLSHIVHLLVLSAHYLGLHLPAEITLPHRDYPRPTIFPLQSSYKFSNLSFASSDIPQKIKNLPRREESNKPRPRPLYIQKPLPTVAIEDSSEYILFLEGIALLAYDVAWVCKSQGIAIGEEENFHDICNIGQNLFNLLINTQPKLSPETRLITKKTLSGRDLTKVYNSNSEDQVAFSQTLSGKYSHNTAYSFLGKSEGTRMINTWKLLSPSEITDRLRSHFMSEAANAEWEMLNVDSWEVTQECDNYESGVVIWQQKRVGKSKESERQNFLSIKNAKDIAEVFPEESEQKDGTGGWTKLKPR
ncbi:hypothetical protein OnM2_012022 [Erysiphe neolycopersici]|uniref:Autophagy-related protein 14 n=1 Tax=Erysiphe neolycopersici TaxID=212602 RepID=A0A420I650_9PEZI|nr:hypothetical protein OnM2_012022 [Erysiphe neolycopersici]